MEMEREREREDKRKGGGDGEERKKVPKSLFWNSAELTQGNVAIRGVLVSSAQSADESRLVHWIDVSEAQVSPYV